MRHAVMLLLLLVATPAPVLLVAVPALLLVTLPAWADQVPLSPPSAQVRLRTYGLGFLPLDGKFTRFRGLMRYDPANPAVCQVILNVETASLEMGTQTMTDRIKGPDSMDVAQFPELVFHGGCQGQTVIGELTLHGQTHPFVLDLNRRPDGIVATGRMKRAEWGITGHPVLGGAIIRIQVDLPNPFAGSHS
jgi:polyisoprenoid-binding protein YceI